MKCEEEAACESNIRQASCTLFQPAHKDKGSVRLTVPAVLLNPSHCTLAPTGMHRECPQQFARARQPVARKCQSRCKRPQHTRRTHLHPHILIGYKTETWTLLWAAVWFEFTYLKLARLKIKLESHEGTLLNLACVCVCVCGCTRMCLVI